MNNLIRQIRRQLSAARRRSGEGRPRYPEELKSEALMAASALYDAGYSHLAASRELDINPVTLSNWQRRAEELDDAESATMLPVDVTQDVEDAYGDHRAPVGTLFRGYRPDCASVTIPTNWEAGFRHDGD